MKKYIIPLIFLIIVIITSGCSNKKNNKDIQNTDINYNNSFDIHITEDRINIIYNVQQRSLYTESEIHNWETYMIEEFGLNIDLILVYSEEEVIEKSKEIDFNGLVVIKTSELLNMLITSNSITNINDYYIKSKVSNIIPKYIANSAKDDVGNMWYLPTSVNSKILGRTYNNDYFDKNRIEVPTTVEKFVQTAIKVKENNDKEIDGYNHIAEFSMETFLFDFFDIFTAYGIYPDIDSSIKHISYNHSRSKWEDIVYNEDFQEALQSIKFLYDNNLIIKYSKEYSSHVHDNTTHNIGTISSYNRAYSDIFSNCIFKLLLEGNNKELLVNMSPSFNGLAILKNTKNIDTILSKITLNGLPTEKLLYAFVYGIPEYNYIETQNLIEYIYIPEGPQKRIMLGIPLILTRPTKLNVLKGDTLNLELKRKHMLYIEAILQQQRLLDEKLIFVNNITIINERAIKESYGLFASTSIFNEFINQVLINGVEINTAIEEYRMKCESLKIKEFLEEVNK